MRKRHRNKHSESFDESQVSVSYPSTCILPPFPPPPIQSYERTKLPALHDRGGSLTGQLIEPRRVDKQNSTRTSGSIAPSSRKNPCAYKPKYCDTAVWTNLAPYYVCLLCGIHFSGGDLLYAHLLLINHHFVPQDEVTSLQFRCRRCGQHWTDKLNVQRLKEMRQHGCVQQKAAYLSKFVIPSEVLTKCGLPFICLFCCTEPSQPPVRRFQQGLRTAKYPIALCEGAMRFESKLHLAVHILCRHSTRAKSDQCGECSFYLGRIHKKEELWEANRFWSVDAKPIDRAVRPQLSTGDYSMSSESESDVPRVVYRLQDSILERQGLPLMEKHLDDTHWPVFKFLCWYIKQSRALLDRTHSDIYDCPLCELTEAVDERRSVTSQGDLPMELNQNSKRCKHPIRTNALLQSHIACYHAGSKQMDFIFGLCQVCGHTDLTKLSRKEGDYSQKEPYLHGSVKHLLRSGHVHRLQREFNQCVEQGRMTAQSAHCCFNWDTMCVFCWQRFTHKLGPNDQLLQARCELQAHLIVSHCGFTSGREQATTIQNQAFGSTYIGRPCGWCGQLPGEFTQPEEETVSESSEFLQTLVNSDPNWKKLYNQYKWYRVHEQAHAAALYDWWRDQARYNFSQLV